jgi:prepilin-type N-terminal cleavage/methylation domain-containing protein/prepilin-type processing-associated H-X9-DG protein
MNRSLKHARRSGFTLIELLVVVAIIALLISILLPSLAAAREQAKRAACAANLKGIAFACLTYAEDSKGVLPSYDQKTSNGQVARVGKDRTIPSKSLTSDPESNTRCYFNLVLSKATQPKIYLCPSATATVDHRYDRSDAARIGTDNPVYDFHGGMGRITEMDHFSYSFANNVVEYAAGGTQKGVRTKNTNDPRKAILADRNPYCNKVTQGGAIDEGLYEYNKDNGPDDPGDTPVIEKPLKNNVANPLYMIEAPKANSRNHKKKGQNVAYLDGHVKWALTPRAGADDDFIWTPLNANNTDDTLPSTLVGAALGQAKSMPTQQTDSFLVP